MKSQQILCLQIHQDQTCFQATDPTARPPVLSPVPLAGSVLKTDATTGADRGRVGLKPRTFVQALEPILLPSPMSRFTSTCNPKTSLGDGWEGFKKKRVTPGSGVTAVPGTTIQDGDRNQAAAREIAFATATKRTSGTGCTAHMTAQSSCVAPKCVQVGKKMNQMMT